MKLSEAMRIGAKEWPQCKSYFFHPTMSNGVDAFGAAYWAVTKSYHFMLSPDDLYRFLKQNFNLDGDAWIGHPDWPYGDAEECEDALQRYGYASVPETLFGVVVDLNDYRDWTIPQIADWLESEGH